MSEQKSVEMMADRVMALLSDELRKKLSENPFDMPNLNQKKKSSSGSRGSSSSSKSKTASFQEGNREGQEVGSQIRSDADELKSGEFAGVINRKIESAKKLKDRFTSKKKSAGDDQGGGVMGFDLSGLSKKQRQNLVFGSAVFKNVKIEKMMGGGFGGGGAGGFAGIGIGGKSPEFQKIMAKQQRENAQAGMILPSGSTLQNIPRSMDLGVNLRGNQNQNAPAGSHASDIGNPLSKLSLSANSFLGGIGAIMGATLAAGSSMAGMHQQAMQGQDSTLDVYGKYVNGGGSLVSNAELAKIGIARAKISGGDHTTNLYEKDTGAHYKKGDLYQWKDEKTGKEYLDVRKEDEKQRYKLKQNNKDVLGIQFGLSQGIGGTAGAELFAKLEKYGQFGGSKNDMKKIMSDAIHSGFTGLRQSEFFQTVSGISEKSYNSGMGIQTAADVSNTLAGIKMTGVRDNRISSVYGAMDSGFKTSGNIMNSIAMAGHLSSGKGILESMKESEKGVTSKQNMGFMKELLGGLDPETRGILEKQWGISTATEAQERVVNGKNLWEVNEQINRQATGTDAAVNKVEGTTGQSYRSTQNAIDTMAATDKTFQQAFQLQQDVAIGLLHLAKNLSKEFQELKKKIE